MMTNVRASAALWRAREVARHLASAVGVASGLLGAGGRVCGSCTQMRPSASRTAKAGRSSRAGGSQRWPLSSLKQAWCQGHISLPSHHPAFLQRRAVVRAVRGKGMDAALLPGEQHLRAISGRGEGFEAAFGQAGGGGEVDFGEHTRRGIIVLLQRAAECRG